MRGMNVWFPRNPRLAPCDVGNASCRERVATHGRPPSLGAEMPARRPAPCLWEFYFVSQQHASPFDGAPNKTMFDSEITESRSSRDRCI